MTKHIFTTNGLVATKWDDATAKAKWLNDLAGFVRSGFDQKKFTSDLYKRLSMTFGHIAHYNQGGFYAEWFETRSDQLRWLNYILQRPNYGDPTFTWSDAERQFQDWLRSEEGRRLLAAAHVRADCEEVADAEASLARAEATLSRHGVS